MPKEYEGISYYRYGELPNQESKTVAWTEWQKSFLGRKEAEACVKWTKNDLVQTMASLKAEVLNASDVVAGIAAPQISVKWAIDTTDVRSWESSLIPFGERTGGAVSDEIVRSWEVTRPYFLKMLAEAREAGERLDKLAGTDMINKEAARIVGLLNELSAWYKERVAEIVTETMPVMRKTLERATSQTAFEVIADTMGWWFDKEGHINVDVSYAE